MSGTNTRKRDRFKRGIRDFFKPSEASKYELSKETEGKDTGNSQIDPSTATSSSASGLIPRHLATAPSTHLIKSSEEAQSPGASKNESFASNSSSQLVQTPVVTIGDTEISQAGKEQANQHTPKEPSVVKDKSLWIEAFESNSLDDRERATLQVIDFQTNAVKSVSEARSCAEEVLKEKKEKYPKVQKLIKWMDRFKEVGDIIVQYDAGHAALPWAGVRLLLKVIMPTDLVVEQANNAP
ncbi:hypothetical protein BZA77DRAFT_358084 [Pyronema omphalodes]|nr:hypothetical protein BZA77DRAFT_358084 [Pyronema omphalodes]